MALIKSKQADALAHDAIVLDLGDLRRQANMLQEKAQADAALIIERAHEETKHIRVAADHRTTEAESICEASEKRGFEEGFASGHEAGLEAGKMAGHEAAFKEASESLDQLQGAWVEAAKHWDSERMLMLQEARESLLRVAVEMAAKIVHRVPTVDSSVVIDQVEQAVRHVADPQDASVHIHPADKELIEEALPLILKKLGSATHVHLVEDEAIERGGCVVTAGNGRVDASLDAQLDRLMEVMLPVQEGGPGVSPLEGNVGAANAEVNEGQNEGDDANGEDVK